MSAEKQRIFLGSRGSELARTQTAMVVNALREAWPELDVRIEMIKTSGDERGLESIDPRAGRKGVFTRKTERARATGEIDVAVHSAQALPSDAYAGPGALGTLPRAGADGV